MNGNALIIFARRPEKGMVKTRLAAAIGDDKALAIYIRLLEHTRDIAFTADCDVNVFLTNETGDDFWSGAAIHLQEGAHLGERMHRSFATVFSLGYKQVVIIGSDCPMLSSEAIDEAFRQLASYDAVIGPAEDGGYYLLGMKALHPAVFEASDWSTGEVFRRTMRDFESGAVTVKVLPVLSDVDEVKDVPAGWL